MGQRPNPPMITGIFVSALAHPDFLVEIDAIAVVPRSEPPNPVLYPDKGGQRITIE
jgi:hypothetical protein